jgi:cyclic pyranopterin monophosphate synthase
MPKLSHYDSSGHARMVDVSAKSATRREAAASAFVHMQPAVLEALPKNPKGDPLEVARFAGIMAAKRTSDLIPMCHPLPLSYVDVDLRLCENGVAITTKVATTASTGVEMEALVAAGVSALTIYDMVKGLDKGVEIRNIVLQHKSGGRSGDYQREEAIRKRSTLEKKIEPVSRNGGSHSHKKQPAK